MEFTKQIPLEHIQNYIMNIDELQIGNTVVCRHCQTPTLYFFAENNKLVHVNCACYNEKIKLERAQEAKEQKFERQMRLLKNSLLNARFESLTFDTLDLTTSDESFVKAKERCERYVQNWAQVRQQGLGIFLYGKCGRGKTALTVCIGKALISDLVPVMFTSFIEITKQIQATYNNSNAAITESELIARLVTVDLLILDDIGAERLTDFSQEIIYYIIDARYKNKLPTIFTSNYSLLDLLGGSQQSQPYVKRMNLEPRTVDRINEMATAVIELRGENYRQKLIKQNEGVF